MIITPAHFKVLKQATEHPLGVVDHVGTINGLGSASKRRMMHRLSVEGLFRPYVHGGWEITDKGRAIVASRS